MSAEVTQNELFDSTDLIFHPNSKEMIRAFADAFVDTPDEESLKASCNSLLEIYRNAWNALNSTENSQPLTKEFNNEVDSQKIILLTYWKGVLLRYVTQNPEEKSIGLTVEMDDNGDYAYELTHQDGDLFNTFKYRFNPRLKLIDYYFHFPRSSCELKNGNKIRESYFNTFRQGDLTYLNRVITLDDERGFQKLKKDEFLTISRD